jgi:flagellin-like protein
MRKLTDNRRAVSPVIATVLMILVTMIGMTLLFAFVSSYSDNYKAGIGSSVMESITVEDIWFSPGHQPYDGSVVISVYNVGKVDLRINSLYVNGLRLSTSFGSDTLIKVGDHVAIPASWSLQSWSSGVTYNFRIVTQSGSKFDVKYTAP